MTQTAWQRHVAQFRINNPHIKGNKVMSAARLTYVPVVNTTGVTNNSNGSSTSMTMTRIAPIGNPSAMLCPNVALVNLTEFLKTEILGKAATRYGISDRCIHVEATNLKEKIDSVKGKKEDIDTIVAILRNSIDEVPFMIKNESHVISSISQNDYAVVKRLLKAYHDDGGQYYTSLCFDEEEQDEPDEPEEEVSS